jgi:hypothetical protein
MVQLVTIIKPKDTYEYKFRVPAMLQYYIT